MRILVFLCFIGVSAFGQDPYKNVYSRHSWKDRDTWQRPDDLIKFMNIRSGSTVADIGCHEGYLTFKLSKIVGEKGEVLAVDVDETKLKKVKQSALENHIPNITTVKGDYDNPKIPLNTVDAVIILDTYHEMDDHDEILQHIKNALKPGGRLILCEAIAEQRRKLTRGEQEGKHELGMPFALADLKKAGFEILFQKDPFIDRTKEKGDKMWILVAVKK